MEGYNENFKSRIIFFISIIFIFVIILSFRLYYIQVFKNQEFIEAALKQRGQEIGLMPKRNIIYDRNLIPLTNNSKTPYIILSKEQVKNNPLLYQNIISHTILSSQELNTLISSNDRLLQIPLREKMSIEEYGWNVFQVDYTNRYNSDNLLSHVIGYINKAENLGQSGLERVYDEFLSEGEKDSLIVEFDRQRSIILGSTHVTGTSDPNNPSAVKTTISFQLQSLVENILDSEGVNGAVVVTQVSTGEILSLASRPNFDQDQIEDYIFNEDMALYNRAIQVAYPPGSIFKIVVLLAALEEDPYLLHRSFQCDGQETINSVTIKCSASHGELSVKEAFAKSCNSTFIQIGKQIGARKIIDMSMRLGFGEKINIGLVEEISGNLPKNNEIHGAAIGNISIGQDKLEVTPLQVSNLLNIIANGGIQKHLTLIKGITNKEGMVLKEFFKEEDIRVLSSESTNILMEMLREVVNTGTGKNIKLNNIGGAAGKTGTAQAILNKQKTIHGWFTGVYPAYDPKYTITVFIEDASSGSMTAAPIFEKIVREIYKLNP